MLTFCSSSLSSTRELGLSGYPGGLGNNLGGEAHRSSIKQLPDALARRGKLIGHGSIRKKNFVQAEGGKLIETFLNCEIEVTPERRKRADDTVREHDDERMAAGPRFQPHVDGAHLKMHGITLAESPLDESKILITVMYNIFGTGSL